VRQQRTLPPLCIEKELNRTLDEDETPRPQTKNGAPEPQSRKRRREELQNDEDKVSALSLPKRVKLPAPGRATGYKTRLRATKELSPASDCQVSGYRRPYAA
jgi:hypothetical protein